MQDLLPRDELGAMKAQDNDKTGINAQDGLVKKPIGISSVISLIILSAVLILISILFFQVMSSFLVPLFLASVMAVVFNPLLEWFQKKMPGRPHMSALATTAAISLLFLGPLSWFGFRAAVETRDVIRNLSDDEKRQEIAVVVGEQSKILGDWYRENIDEGFDINQWYQGNFGDEFDIVEASQTVLGILSEAIVPLGVTGIKAAFAFFFGLGVMIFALYYFLADGPGIIDSLMRLSPMDDSYERELLHQFSSVSRAVVVATLVTAIAQGLLAGIGYHFIEYFHITPPEGAAADFESKNINLPVFLLTVLTMLFSIVPLVGAMAVWVPVAVWVTFFIPGGFWPGLIFAIYCFVIVSSADNVIKPYVLSGQSNLHPLLALLSVLGGVQLLGAIGILVGPMLVAFMQTLLGLLRKEIDRFKEAETA